MKEVQTTNRQHAVPQNIMDVEFKIIGELTLRQFSYLVVFGGLTYVSIAYVGGIFKWPLAGLFFLLGIGLAFVPLEERGMDQWIINFIKAVYAPNQKIWRREPTPPSVFLYQDMAVVRQELITLTPTTSRRKLEEYLEMQDNKTVPDRLDIPEQKYIKFVRDSFGGKAAAVTAEPYSPPAPPAQQAYVGQQVQASEPSPMPKPPAPPRPVAPPPPPPPPPPQPEEKKEMKEPPPMPVKPPASPVETREKIAEQTPKEKIIEPPPMPKPPAPPRPVVPPPPPPPPPPVAKKLEIIKSTGVGAPQDLIHKKSEDMPLTPLTPDRHSGRRFVSLLPKQGSIVLPVRAAQKVLKTSAEEEIEEDIRQKTEQLNKLIAQIKSDESYQKGTDKKPEKPKEKEKAPEKPKAQPSEMEFPPEEKTKTVKVEYEPMQIKEIPEEIDAEAYQDKKGEIDNIMDSFRKENERIIGEIKRLRDDIQRSGGTDNSENEEKRRLLERLERRKERATQDYQNLQNKIRELELKVKAREKIIASEMSKPEEEERKPTVAKVAKMQPLTTKPNIISGIVKSAEGVGMEGVVAIIKNERGETVRALKTNALGQFSLVSPLANGMYNIEIDPFNNSGLSFDIISLEVKGEVIPPLDFVGK
jgi:hypothetical protein